MLKTKPPAIIGLKELRENFDRYITLVDRGMRFTVVRRSKPVFDMAPAESGSDENWETVIDFTKIRPGGVPIKEVLTRIKRYGK